MSSKYTYDDLVERLSSPGWGLVMGNESMPIQGTLNQMVVVSHDRQKNGQSAGLIRELETEIELDMLQIQALWRQLGLPT